MIGKGLTNTRESWSRARGAVVLVLLATVVVLNPGVSCRIVPTPPDGNTNNNSGGSFGVRAALDDTDATITIVQESGSSNATVSAAITDSRGRGVDLSDDQDVEVNGRSLQGEGGDYERTVTAANEYTITVREPTRGVEQSTVTGPVAFAVISPASGESASLSGFTLTWSQRNANLQVRVRISQTIFNENRVENFGPFADTGELVLTLADLSDFRQGADLLIEVTKESRDATVDGFDSAEVTVMRSATRTVSPGA